MIVKSERRRRQLEARTFSNLAVYAIDCIIVLLKNRMVIFWPSVFCYLFGESFVPWRDFSFCISLHFLFSNSFSIFFSFFLIHLLMSFSIRQGNGK